MRGGNGEQDGNCSSLYHTLACGLCVGCRRRVYVQEAPRVIYGINAARTRTRLSKKDDVDISLFQLV